MSNSLLGPAAPSLDEPIEMLDACHGRIRAQIETLARLVAHLPVHGADGDARRAAAAVIRYFELAAPSHHADEEEDVFPALRAAATSADRAVVEALLVRLLADHRRMNEARERLLVALRLIAAGEGGALDGDEVESFAGLYLAHIDAETNELFLLARRLLAVDELARIGRRMAARRGVSSAG